MQRERNKKNITATTTTANKAEKISAYILLNYAQVHIK